MKRRMFFGIMAVAALLSMSSCANEDAQVVGPENSEVVSFNVLLEGGMTTRAISDGKSANQLMYGVFAEDGTLVIAKNVEDNAGDMTGGYTVNFTLAKGHKYRVVFWAQNSKCTAYTVSDDMKVTIDYEGLNNDESRDAFFAYADIVMDGTTPDVVILKRPFAQVNLATYQYDVDYGKELGVEITKSVAKIAAVPNTLNLFDGSVSGSADIVYQANAIPTERLNVDIDKDGTKEDYAYLSMCYILADATSSTHQMSFDLLTENGDTQSVDSGLGAVPVQRNWRTNIVGQCITGDVSVKIQVAPAYDGDEIVNSGLYYNFNEDVLVQDRLFTFDNLGSSITFASENNATVTLDNVTFAGQFAHIDMGEYRDKGNYVDFTNILTNVVVEDVVFSSAIKKSVPPTGATGRLGCAMWLRGENDIDNCKFTGATCNDSEVNAYDLALVNFSTATVDNTTIDRIYLYEHSNSIFTGCTIGYIAAGAIDTAQNGKLVIASGTTVDTIDVVKIQSGYLPNIEIQAGATVGTINFNGLPQTMFVNNGTVTTIND